MDSAIRDLDQIHEQSEEEVRKIGLWVMAAIAIASVIFAVTVLIAQARGSGAPDGNVYERLDRAAELGLKAAPASQGAGLGDEDIDAQDMRFPEVLLSDERAEVAATMAAVTAELQHPQQATDATPQPGGGAALAQGSPILPSNQGGIPVDLAGSTNRGELARSAAGDPLMASAMRPPPEQDSAQRGHEGKFTIQVISYESRDSAEAFASGLQARGHRAFVQVADIEGRGRMYRVRIGPFNSQSEAQGYRRDFEATERMHTIVVRRDS